MLKGYESSAYHSKLPLVAIALMAFMVLMICYAMFSTAPKGYPGLGSPAMHRSAQPLGAGVTRDTLRKAM